MVREKLRCKEPTVKSVIETKSELKTGKWRHDFRCRHVDSLSLNHDRPGTLPRLRWAINSAQMLTAISGTV